MFFLDMIIYGIIIKILVLVKENLSDYNEYKNFLYEFEIRY